MQPIIDHINRYVSDVEEHVAFYTRALGYTLLERGTKDDGNAYAVLEGHGHELFISEKPGCGANPMYRTGSGAGISAMNSFSYALLPLAPSLLALCVWAIVRRNKAKSRQVAEN